MTCPVCKTIMIGKGKHAECECGIKLSLPPLPKGGGMKAFNERWANVEVVRR